MQPPILHMLLPSSPPAHSSVIAASHCPVHLRQPPSMSLLFPFFPESFLPLPLSISRHYSTAIAVTSYHYYRHLL
ncbi:hypothetical protein GW17_00031915 [Ensete ventricosum]|nr:hypothetical protein GW17_00031915 [Ensete ventricosum]RZS22960.1 hypothetical protein BHM03_00055802 [Ensete ventricosum]